MTDTNTTAVAEPKTLEQKLAIAEAQVAKIKAAIATAAIVGDIQRGDKVIVKYGRADTARAVNGEVVGVALPKVAILSDDFDTFTVHVNAVITNFTKDGRANGPDPVAQVEQPAGGPAPVLSDPLLAD